MPGRLLAGADSVSLPVGVWLTALGLVAVELAASGRYGFHRDELYFIVAGSHPAFGYVDQPPLAPLIARAATIVLGTTPTAVRIVPALAGAAVVVLAAMTAREIGGGRFAQILSAVAVACAPVVEAAAHLANTTVYDLLAWAAIVLLVLRAINREQPAAWLGAGLAAGLGLENKDLPLLLVLGVTVGLVLTGRWRALLNRWALGGVAIALALWAPNLAWQATHGWPQLAMSRALHAEHSTAGDYSSVLPAELLYLGLASVPLAWLGLRRLWRETELRFLAVAAIVVLAFVAIEVPGRPYYADGLLPVVFAAGAVAVEQRERRLPWLVAPLALAAAMLVLVLPILPLSTLGQMSFMHKLNYDQGETVGWPQLTATVDGVLARLPPRERRSASVFTSNYGEASALVVYGARLGIPAPLSGHNNYWLWGPGSQSDRVVIAVGSAGDLRPFFARCVRSAVFRTPDGVNDDENGTVISTCTGPRAAWPMIWPRLRHYD